MSPLADLHVHSKYSRATARDLDLENLGLWALKKGVDLVGTGDFTHPAWFAEIREKLVPDGSGLFRLPDDLFRAVSGSVPGSCRNDVRFVLSVEISNIYKKDGRTRKVHNLVILPGLAEAERFNLRLARIGNIASDGRPILGLDSRNLLEIALECSDAAIFIPAHIWTPWFSLLGDKSGFDSIEECFGDLSGHVTALETGLSSDPPMNRMVSSLDGRVLVSNSDAHSPSKLGREANVLSCELSYPALRKALAGGGGLSGTIEFFPEEGKYHADGHRSCGVRLAPEETTRLGGVCPACGAPLTVGVLSRVRKLADRSLAEARDLCRNHQCLAPLSEVLSELLGVGPASGKVEAAYEEALAAFGPEYVILRETPVEDLARFRAPLLGEAVSRMRAGRVIVSPGYDGVYGVIRLFGEGELSRLKGQQALFGPSGGTGGASGASKGKAAADPARPAERAPGAPSGPAEEAKPGDSPGTASEPSGLSIAEPSERACRAPSAGRAAEPPALNPLQREAVEAPAAPLLIVAGPGTGKTRTLAHRAAHLIRGLGAAPESVLALTFTNKAAAEMRERLAGLLPEAGGVTVCTFHALGLSLLSETPGGPSSPAVLDEEDRLQLLRRALSRTGLADADPRAESENIRRAKERLWVPEAEPAAGEGLSPAVFRAYRAILRENNSVDMDDLVYLPVRALESEPSFRDACRRRFRHVLVDEYQDVSPSQHRLLMALCPEGASITAIGDPDQAIYGFRGADAALFRRFTWDHPGARVVELSVNYRSTDEILAAAERVVTPGRLWTPKEPLRSGIPGRGGIRLLRTATAEAEAETVVAAIEDAVGGVSHFSMDSGRAAGGGPGESLGFGDFAVLVRAKAQFPPLVTAFARSGIPFETADRRKLAAAPGVSALLSHLRLAIGAGTDADFLRAVNTPRRGVTEAVITCLEGFAARLGTNLPGALKEARRLPVPGLDTARQRKLFDFGTDLAGLAARLENREAAEAVAEAAAFLGLADPPGSPGPMAALSERARPFRGDLRGFMASLALSGDQDAFDPDADRVLIMTAHAAKGLEFDVVIVAGAEEGLFPLDFPGRAGDPAEERRLFYVAVTRARRAVWLLRAQKRRLFGREEAREISPFARELAPRLAEETPVGSLKRKIKGPVQTEFDFG